MADKRLQVLSHNAWLYPHEREQARHTAEYGSPAECLALADKLSKVKRDRINKWRNAQ